MISPNSTFKIFCKGRSTNLLFLLPKTLGCTSKAGNGRNLAKLANRSSHNITTSQDQVGLIAKPHYILDFI
jgi:hypothetical protein